MRRRRPRRYAARREAGSRLLVLCEGKRTEPNYFTALVRNADLTSVKVEPGRGALAHLERRIKTATEEDPELDEIWCVLDHDGRDREVADFLSGVSAIRRRCRRPLIHTILSIPCFELWFLLHFEFTNRPYRGATGTDSGCGEVIQRLKSTYLNDYDKKDPNLFRRLESRMDTALGNAKHRPASEVSSTTEVWKLVERLHELRVSDPLGR